MKKNQVIRDRESGCPTPYYLAGKSKKIVHDGSFSSLLHRMWHQDTQIQNTYKLAAITADFIYYVDEDESDETSCVVMLDRNFNLISDNFLASNDLTHLVEKNEGLLWISNSVKYWQKEEFVQAPKITPRIKKMLQQVDEEKLTEMEKAVYFAYRHRGPVKYSKAQSLMAVISNALDQANSSGQLAAITDMLDQNTK